MPIFHRDVCQGTTEWLALRAGIPTASSFDRILTPRTGKPSSSAEGYLFSLLAERLMGKPIVEHVSLWMERGSHMEADAVSFYEFQRDIKTETVGFVTNDKNTIGASPDRLVGADGLLEIKVPAPHTHIGYLLRAGSAYDAYKVQVQGQLWIAEREWADVLSFHPEMPPALIRIERDEEYIQKLSAAVTAFSEALEEQWMRMAEEGWGPPPPPKPVEKTTAQLLKEELAKMNRESYA